MSGLDQLRHALEVKQGIAKPAHRKVAIPDPIVYATDGVSKELKINGKVVGTITYDPKPS